FLFFSNSSIPSNSSTFLLKGLQMYKEILIQQNYLQKICGELVKYFRMRIYRIEGLARLNK
ncbi:MAG: hypothetical protein EBU52_19625, partial [Cytophagia bacterium]|nr:hypothetical protein [Cytophagia bacterium]